MTTRLLYPAFLNALIAALLVSAVLATGFSSPFQALIVLALFGFGVFNTARTLRTNRTEQIYSDPWWMHFALQPLSLAASAIVIGAILRYGNDVTWAMIAAGYLCGARCALALDGFRRIRS